MTTFAVHPDAAPLYLELLRAIAEAGATPCTSDPAPFTSDHRTERAEAAAACQWCPALEECRAFADTQSEVWHVWAGVDRTPTRLMKEKAA